VKLFNAVMLLACYSQDWHHKNVCCPDSSDSGYLEESVPQFTFAQGNPVCNNIEMKCNLVV
jgi:hypothetical protein